MKGGVICGGGLDAGEGGGEIFLSYDDADGGGRGIRGEVVRMPALIGSGAGWVAASVTRGSGIRGRSTTG